MEIEIDLAKSSQENAVEYFNRSKKEKRKAEGAKKSIEDLKGRLKELEKHKETAKKIKKIKKREWYEKFNWFFTSNNFLAIGGRSADQNDELYAKHFEANDLFFHANILGASAVILKGGVEANRGIREEAAQFAACFSNAWENQLNAIDVYELRKEQVTKSRNAGALAKGAFVLIGEREWYRNMPLALGAFVSSEKINVAPLITCKKGDARFLTLTIGKMKKSDTAKAIAKKLDYDDIDYIMQHLPSGPFSIKD